MGHTVRVWEDRGKFRWDASYEGRDNSGWEYLEEDAHAAAFAWVLEVKGSRMRFKLVRSSGPGGSSEDDEDDLQHAADVQQS